MASVYKRGNIWWGKASRNGKVHRRSLRTASKPIAEKRLREWLDQLDAIQWGEKPRRMFDDAAEKFILEHLPTLKPQSARRYITSLKQLGSTFSGLYLDQISSSKLYEYELRRKQVGITSPTIRRDLACLSSLFGCCQDWEWCDGNPVRPYLKRRRKRGNLREAPPRTRYLSHKEESNLLDHCSEHVRIAAQFAIDTGLRREELFSLTWQQIDLANKQIIIDGVAGSGTKNRTSRIVPLLPRAAQFLAQHPRQIRSTYVFCHTNGERFIQMERGFKAACRRARISNLRWHDLRRTCGCRLLQDHKLSLEEVKSWLGHKSVVVTERAYAFLDIEKMKEKVQRPIAEVISLQN